MSDPVRHILCGSCHDPSTGPVEQALGTSEFEDLLLELGVLTALVITLSVAFYFVRRSNGERQSG